MKKIIVGVFATITVVAVAVVAYKFHQREQYKETLIPAVKNASIRVTNSSRMDLEKSNVTYKELFDRLDADVAEIDKRLIDVQSGTTTDTATISSPTIAYLQSCQEISRALSMKYRKQLALSHAIERTDDSIRDVKSSDSYGYKYAKARMDKTFEDMKKAREEYNSSVEDIIAASKKLKSARTAMAIFFDEQTLVSTKQLDDLLSKNEKQTKAEAKS